MHHQSGDGGTLQGAIETNVTAGTILSPTEASMLADRLG